MQRKQFGSGLERQQVAVRWRGDSPSVLLLLTRLPGASFFSYYAEEALRVYGETIPANSPQQRILVLRQPVGVVREACPVNTPAQPLLRTLAALHQHSHDRWLVLALLTCDPRGRYSLPTHHTLSPGPSLALSHSRRLRASRRGTFPSA
jgi:hypothetical protein